MRRELFISLFLTLATLAVFWQVRHHDFIDLDDCMYVTQNVHVQKGLSPHSIAWAFTSFDAGFWIPLTWLSFMLDFELYGLNAGGYHLTNLFFHVLNTLLLFLLLNKMTRQSWRSGFVAVLFALHPLRVESVAWVTERKDVLSTFFLILAIWSYLRYIERPERKRYVVILLVFTLGLMAKPMVVTFPFILLLLDYWPLGRLQLRQIDPGSQPPSPSPIDYRHDVLPTRRLVWEKLPFFAVAVVCSISTVFAHSSVHALGNLDKYPLGIRFANALISYVSYIWKMIWPHHLVILYLHPGESVSMLQAAGAGILLAGISVLLIWTGRRSRYLAVGWLWYLGTLLPVIGLVQAGFQAMADRFTYIPLIGLFIIIAWGVPDLLARWHYRRIAIAFTTSLLLPFLMVSTWTQLSHWHNRKTLWEYTLAVAPNHYYALNSLGEIASDEGDLEKALVYYAKAFEVNPRYKSAISNIGSVFYKQGKYDEAIKRFYQALKMDPDDAVIHSNLGEAFSHLGNIDKAIFHFTEAVTFDPKNFKAHNHLGMIFARQGKLNQAISHFSQAIKINPDYAEAHDNLGAVFLRKGKPDEALKHFSEAVKINPDYAEAQNNLGALLVQQGNFDEAITHLSRALGLNPNYATAHNNMGDALARQGEFDEAISHYSQALQIDPDYVDAHRNLALLLATRGKLEEAVYHFSEVLRLQPKSAQTHNNLGYLLAQQGKFDQAISHFNEALRLKPDYAQARMNLAVVTEKVSRSARKTDFNSRP